MRTDLLTDVRPAVSMGYAQALETGLRYIIKVRKQQTVVTNIKS